MATWNEDVTDTWDSDAPEFGVNHEQGDTDSLPPRLNSMIREYFEEAKRQVDGGTWLERPEIPTSREMLDLDECPAENGSTGSGAVSLTPNKKVGGWPSKEEYLGAHYELLRENAVRNLREAVGRVRMIPDALEDAWNGEVGIYEKVRICGVTCSYRGMATRVSFSLRRTGKQILWEQSKRLTTGGLVVLTSKDDMFQSQAIVAVVAARPLAALAQNPPEIDLYIHNAEEQELDPSLEFVMVEDRGGLYEADRHTLVALQKMMRESSPLLENIIGAKKDVEAPAYVRMRPRYDLSSVIHDNKNETYESVDILAEWPAQPPSYLDASQLAALQRMLTKKLAIIQGPPGTGKTFISVQAIKIMLANRQFADPPIIIACQTNHAVDQILRLVATFEPDFIRLGGRSKDRDVVKTRTLYEVKKLKAENPIAGSLAPMATRVMRTIEKEVKILLSPLDPKKKEPLDVRILESVGLLSKEQANSLEQGAAHWVQAGPSDDVEALSPFRVWLGKRLIPVLPIQPEDFGFEFEETDLVFEQLRELEAETVARDDEEYEALPGAWVPIKDHFTCEAGSVTMKQAQTALSRCKDLWKIPEYMRPAVYLHLQRESKTVLLHEFRKKAKAFHEQASLRRIGNWEKEEPLLKQQKIIGMTTTGLSKYRGLLASLQPKIVLIEEAAEILEAPVAVACLPSLQQLILVGDHLQLRPHCHVRQLEDDPFYLNISMFERLVKSKVEYSSLAKQRRMIPEIRRILYPIYGDNIKDDASVLSRKDVAGMGGINSFFFTHEWPEARDDQMSSYNQNEAEMIAGFVEYLCYNGVDADEITVLTFYNGQRKKILKLLRERPTFAERRFNVVTVDSYQGEENDVVILSLVRSNDRGQIGFLGISNRVCVALSRARNGFYLFGNGQALYTHPIWKAVLNIMGNHVSSTQPIKDPQIRIAYSLPLKCQIHGNETEIMDASDFTGIYGGCKTETCHEVLPCGHTCPLSCHPFAHDIVNCQQPCTKVLPCGHGCTLPCGFDCECTNCPKRRAPGEGSDVKTYSTAPDTAFMRGRGAAPWRDFGNEAPIQYAAAAEAATSAPWPRLPASPSTLNRSRLVEFGDGEGVATGVEELSLSAKGSTSRTDKQEEQGGAVNVVESSTPAVDATAASEGDTAPLTGEEWSHKNSLLD